MVKISGYRTLIALRKFHGMNQQQVAAHLCLSRPTYSKYETNELELTISQLVSLTKLYDITLIDFINMIWRENYKEELVSSVFNNNEMANLIRENISALNNLAIGSLSSNSNSF